MYNVEVITTGSELLDGRTLDTNFQYIARQLRALGYHIAFHSSYRDDLNQLTNGIRLGLSRADIVILSGGLGPTKDDLTREAAAKAVRSRLNYHPDEEKRLRKFFKNRAFPANIRRQCHFPEKSTLITNRVGTATGFIVYKSKKAVIALSGVPKELKPMLANVITLLRLDGPDRCDVTPLHYKFFDIPEAIIDNRFSRILPILGDRYTYNISAKDFYVTVNIETDAGQDSIYRFQAEVSGSLGNDLITTNEMERLEHATANLLMKKWQKIAVAESCTGGLITHKLTNVPGISGSLYCGIVTYSNEAKVGFLNVSRDDLLKYGAVSEEVAISMARGVRKAAGAHYGLSTTGIAGPIGETKFKPIGLVHFGLSSRSGDKVTTRIFKGDRLTIKENASDYALNLLRKHILSS